MQPASHGDNPAAPAPASLIHLIRAAAALHLRATREALPVGAECAERRAVVGACPNVGRDLRDALAEALAAAARDVDAAALALEQARETLEARLRDRRDLRDAIRDARETGEVPALSALGDNNTRRWHPVDGWQDGNEPPTGAYALGLALAEADAATASDCGTREVKRAADAALAEDEDREDAAREAAHGDGFDD